MNRIKRAIATVAILAGTIIPIAAATGVASAATAKPSSALSCGLGNDHAAMNYNNAPATYFCSVGTTDIANDGQYNTQLEVQGFGVRIWMHAIYPDQGTAWCFNPGKNKLGSYNFTQGSGQSLAEDVRVTTNTAAC